MMMISGTIVKKRTVKKLSKMETPICRLTAEMAKKKIMLWISMMASKWSIKNLVNAEANEDTPET